MAQRFFDYFQLVCLIFFLFVFVGRTLYLRVRRNIRVFTLGVAKVGLQRAVEVFFLIALVVWIAEVFSSTQPGSVHLFPPSLTTPLIAFTPAKIAGAALIVFGQIVFILALLAFGDSWRVGIDTQSPGLLVTGGVFSVSRNPIFFFIDLYFVGTFLINGTAIFLAFAILVVAGLHYQILQEERFLSSNYGKSYRSYLDRTHRYFGWRRDIRGLRTDDPC
ncbi:MAG: isoprenylcysteine carboxylmethyltransferase family protein [Anaerolineae bacterium]|nr:isoprenylcysteine carboxylmethyltransferase family protein [Anaerolineae bacterium]